MTAHCKCEFPTRPVRKRYLLSLTEYFTRCWEIKRVGFFSPPPNENKKWEHRALNLSAEFGERFERKSSSVSSSTFQATATALAPRVRMPVSHPRRHDRFASADSKPLALVLHNLAMKCTHGLWSRALEMLECNTGFFFLFYFLFLFFLFFYRFNVCATPRGVLNAARWKWSFDYVSTPRDYFR